MLPEHHSKIQWVVFICFLFAGNSGDLPTFQYKNYDGNPHPLLFEPHKYFVHPQNNTSFEVKILALRGGFHDKITSPTMRKTPRSVAADAGPLKVTGAAEQPVRLIQALPSVGP
jgi:hypothetical protein